MMQIEGCIIYVMGVSGSGKTTIGQHISARTGLPFFDADDFHSVANKEKMRASIPLTDEDRKDWLESLNELAREQSNLAGAVIACSALKERYRLVLADDIHVPVHWVFLQGTAELIAVRLQSRKSHFMPAALLESQFEALETPRKAIVVDISLGIDEIVNRVLAEIAKLSQDKE